jgi:hypothetical protein
MAAKTLIIDIETAPALGDVWGLWQNNVGLNQLRKSGYIMSYAAKWLGKNKVYYDDCSDDGQADECHIVEGMCELLDEADIVVAHNGDKFDLPWIRGRALKYGLVPPSPYKQIDTLKTAKREFRFISNKLEYLADFLGCAPKKRHLKFPGHEMWTECIRGNQAAWREMKKYNIQDIKTLEEVYLLMRPWMRNHPNLGVYAEDEDRVCPKCGSKHLHSRGYTTTQVGKYQKFQCQDCGGWSRTRFTEYPKDKRPALLINAQ